jgi:hypothetical protein
VGVVDSSLSSESGTKTLPLPVPVPSGKVFGYIMGYKIQGFRFGV